MQVTGHVHNGSPILKKFMSSADIVAGAPLISAGVASGANDSGAVITIANAAGNPLVGLARDAVSFPANPEAQLNTDASIFVTVDVRPDAIMRAKMSGSGTEDTALNNQATSAASALGVVTTGVTTLDDGVVWGYEGANAGSFRRADDTSGSVSIAFPNAIASGDQFLAAQGFMGVVATSQQMLELSAAFTQVDITTTDSDNDNFTIFDWELKDVGGDGTTNSYYHLIAWQHIYSGSVNQT